MRLIGITSIRFKCDHCGAINEGVPSEFKKRNTYPPTWDGTCVLCSNDSVITHPALISILVGRLFE